MALIIETGAGVPGANSFVTVAEADTFLANLGDAQWAGLTTLEKEPYLIRGAFYVSNGMIYIYTGTLGVYGQGLAWPRAGAYYRGGTPTVPALTIPPEVKTAQIVAAQAALQGILPGAGTGGGSVGTADVKKEKVGELEVEYFDPARSNGGASAGMSGEGALIELGLPSVTGILAPLLDETWYLGTLAVTSGLRAAPIAGVRMAQPSPRKFWPDLTGNASAKPPPN
jgi:hypothetical protein